MTKPTHIVTEVATYLVTADTTAQAIDMVADEQASAAHFSITGRPFGSHVPEEDPHEPGFCRCGWSMTVFHGSSEHRRR